MQHSVLLIQAINHVKLQGTQIKLIGTQEAGSWAKALRTEGRRVWPACSPRREGQREHHQRYCLVTSICIRNEVFRGLKRRVFKAGCLAPIRRMHVTPSLHGERGHRACSLSSPFSGIGARMRKHGMIGSSYGKLLQPVSSSRTRVCFSKSLPPKVMNNALGLVSGASHSVLTIFSSSSPSGT